jgi:hypothetical protein
MGISIAFITTENIPIYSSISTLIKSNPSACFILEAMAEGFGNGN